MSWEWIVGWVALLVIGASVSRILRRAVWAFAVVAGLLLLLHWNEDPGEAATGFAVLGGGLVAMRPMRRLMMGLVG
ncbi:hypothetical protein [Pelagovum pacificum]|uniref:Uncharacterized protein n=1 Tax=Pelagovum pacificum TaxID=2588711 RepID=A0A5C5G7H3_9RHOB|nr:hypothetical protein [Pelagovum pacificum]QQA41844.1 hypothetical protein I8N54_13700 [Pelagovum pacificum]TNY30713.1 hypothetical protein FHY64_19230 [Pelagovum pacificum]